MILRTGWYSITCPTCKPLRNSTALTTGGRVVIIMHLPLPRVVWPIIIIIKVFTGRDRFFRTATVRTVYIRGHQPTSWERDRPWSPILTWWVFPRTNASAKTYYWLSFILKKVIVLDVFNTTVCGFTEHTFQWISICNYLLHLFLFGFFFPLFVIYVLNSTLR